MGDPFIPKHEEPPRRGAVPVRFFGTYDFAWIESQRTLAPLSGCSDDHASKCKTQARRGLVTRPLPRIAVMYPSLHARVCGHSAISWSSQLTLCTALQRMLWLQQRMSKEACQGFDRDSQPRQ